MPVLSPFSSSGHFFKGNIHAHTNRSDGALPPAETVRHYKAAGYDFVAITDHYNESFGCPVTDTRAFRDESFTTILGAELHVPRSEGKLPWHLVGVGLPLDFPPPCNEEDGPALAKRAREAGAFVGLAHPSWYQLSLAEGESVAPYAHAVEIYNHGCQIIHDKGDGAYMLDGLSDRGCRLLTYACDDAHFRQPDFGHGWVEVKAGERSPEALLAALKAGHYYSSQGPELFSVVIENDGVTVECSPAESVIAVGCGKLYSVCFDAGITRCTLSMDGVRQSPWLRIVVTDQKGRRAWTNPHWLAG